MVLRLSLRPGERFIVNGAELRNGDRRAAFVIQGPARVVRGDMLDVEANEESPPEVRMFVSFRDVYKEQGVCPVEAREAMEKLCETYELAANHPLRTSLRGIDKNPYPALNALYLLLSKRGILDKT